MAVFTVQLGKSKTEFKLNANSCDEISLLIAAELPEEWYGLFIQKDTTSDEPPTFMCNCVKSYYEECCPNMSPLELATNQMLSHIRHQQPELREWVWDYSERDEVCIAHTLKEGLNKGFIKEIK